MAAAKHSWIIRGYDTSKKLFELEVDGGDSRDLTLHARHS